MSKDKPPFEPPPPQPVSPLEVVGGIVLLAGIVVVDTATGGLLTCLDAIPAPPQEPAEPARVVFVPGMTSAPICDARGNAQCTRCQSFVPYPSMSLNEDGYFCARCAATLVAAAADG